MDFTREPIIETVVTPKEGCKLVVRSSKSAGQEEYFVDALEVVSFGNALFFRSFERPKAFLVPASDYEVLEVREARMVLKNVGIERSIKIGGGKPAREQAPEKAEPVQQQPEMAASVQEGTTSASEGKGDSRLEKRRDRRRHARKRRGGSDDTESDTAETVEKEGGEREASTDSSEKSSEERVTPSNGGVAVMLPPPTMLISETIARYRDNALFKSAFYIKEEEEAKSIALGHEPIDAGTEEGVVQYRHPEEGLIEAIDLKNVTLETSEYGSFGSTEEDQSGQESEPRQQGEGQAQEAPESQPQP